MVLYNAILNSVSMCGKCGPLKNASIAFNDMNKFITQRPQLLKQDTLLLMHVNEFLT